jgi:hypothetical protein
MFHRKREPAHSYSYLMRLQAYVAATERERKLLHYDKDQY